MKKALRITKNVTVWLVFLVAIAMMIFTLISINVLDQNERSLFGFHFFVAQSDSMEATDFAAGDVIIVKRVDVKTLQEGDVITFVSQNSHNLGQTVTHKVRKVVTDAYGNVAFVTYGTTTGVDDEALATVVIGEYVGRLPSFGRFFQFLKSTSGYIFFILLPFLILIFSQTFNCIRLFRQHKREKTEKEDEERKKIEEELAEGRRIKAELLELKAQLNQKENENRSPSAESETTAQEPI